MSHSGTVRPGSLEFDRLTYRLDELERLAGSYSKEKLGDALGNDVSTLKRRMDRMDSEVNKKDGRDDYGSEARDDDLSARVTELEVSVKLLQNGAHSAGPDTPDLDDQIDALAKRVEKTEA
jgi:outer membrane murein-binding lipoprotein Lpp